MQCFKTTNQYHKTHLKSLTGTAKHISQQAQGRAGSGWQVRALGNIGEVGHTGGGAGQGSDATAAGAI